MTTLTIKTTALDNNMRIIKRLANGSQIIAVLKGNAYGLGLIKFASFLHGKTTFDTNLGLEFLQEYFIITLDVFKENQYSKEKSTQNAWLSLFTAESVDDLERLVAEYPWMAGICKEIADYLYKPGEVLNMFSEALRILDDNTAQYMVDEMKKEIQEKDELIAEKDIAIAEKDAAFDAVMNEKNMAIAEKNKALAEIETLKAMLAEKNE